jgi:hypothetical protein
MTSKADEMKDRKKLVGSTTDFTTYHQLTSTEVGGRFAIDSPRPSLTGEARDVRYPRLPSNSPWSHDPVGVEPPTNYRIDQLEPTGEFHELAASSGYPLPDDAVAPPPPINQPLEERGGGGELSARVALSSSNPDGDAQLARGVAPSSGTSLPGDVETSSSHPYSGREDLAELVGRLIVPAQRRE